jgi:hypothetical protein
MSSLDDYPFLKKGVGVLLLIGGGALLAFLLYSLSRDLSLWVLGRRASAQVIDQWVEATNPEEQDVLEFRYYIRYAFSTPSGRIVVSTKTVAAQEWVGVGQGAQGQGGADFYSGDAVGPAAPVYQEQEHLSEFAAGGLMSAPTVDIVYFPLYPEHNRLEESRFVPILACTYVPLLVVTVLALLAARGLLGGPSTRGQHAEHRDFLHSQSSEG